MSKKKGSQQADDRVVVSVRLDPEMNELLEEYIGSHKYKPSKQQVLETLLLEELRKFSETKQK